MRTGCMSTACVTPAPMAAAVVLGVSQPRLQQPGRQRQGWQTLGKNALQHVSTSIGAQNTCCVLPPLSCTGHKLRNVLHGYQFTVQMECQANLHGLRHRASAFRSLR
jgi:hypothetical protein